MRFASIESLESELVNDKRIKVAGIDVDGILRGKFMSKSKFLSAAKNGFGFCSVTFGWDMHDKTYSATSSISNQANGFLDITARIDLESFRRIPWENGQPFFLLTFHDSSEDDKAIVADPRSLLRIQLDKAEKHGYKVMCGLEFEFFNFLETPASLEAKAGRGLQSITPGNFGYSIIRPNVHQEYFTSIFDTGLSFGCPLEGWHTETGPGVYEAALEFCEAGDMADRAVLFKYMTKALGLKHGITPCFMAKPAAGLSGNSGHIHLSLASPDGTNLFYRTSKDKNPQYPDIAHFSDIARHFIAGILEGLPDIMPLLAPNINSYKRLVENYWAPVTVSWGLEHRLASVRLIAPPTCAPKSTRIEIRVPGADNVPHFAISALIALGLRGIANKSAFPVPPISVDIDAGLRLAKDLREATDKFAKDGSLARECLGDSFVDHYAMTRRMEIKEWESSVTEWEVKRYMEVV